MGQSLITVASGDALTCPRCGTHHALEHRFCGNCGAELTPPSPAASAPAGIDRLAGAPYVPGPEHHPAAGVPAPSRPNYPGLADDDIPYYIPPARVALLTFLSAGLYALYWAYITWRHYRDHTGETAYPFWHALAMLVPFYGLFRLHAHFRVFQELMEMRGVPTTLNPLRAAGLGLIWWMLLLAEGTIVADSLITPVDQVAYFALNAAQVGLLAFVMHQAQGNINRFWRHRLGMRLGWMRLSLMEMVLVALGLLEWMMIAIILIDPSILITQPADAPAIAP